MMPADLGQALGLLPSLARAEEATFSGPDAAQQRELSDPETARQLFRQFRYQVMSGPQETLRQLRKLCFQWLQPEVHTKEQILDILMLEQFLNILPGEIQMWVRKQCPGSGEEAATLVESLKGDPWRLWQWINIQVLGQEIPSEKEKPAHRQEDKVEPPLEVVPQDLPLQKSPSASRELLSHDVKKESDMEPELALATSQLPAQPEERPIRDQDVGTALQQEQWRQLDSTQKEQYWDLMLENYGKMVSGVGISDSKPDLTNLAESGEELAGLHLHVAEKMPRPTCKEDRQENDKENLNLENHRDQGSLDAFCQASGGAAPQTALSDFLGESELHRFGGESVVPEALESLQGEGTVGQLFSHERGSGKQLGQHTQSSSSGELSALWLEDRREAAQKGQARAPMTQKLPTFRECGKTFSRNSQLVFHQRTHTGETYFHCLICKKAFLRSSDFVKHQRTHTGEKPCKCDYCGKGFSDVSGLRHHKKIHTGEKPYKCFICEKSFIQRSNFNRHQRVHTGEKPYKCTDCSKCFSWSSSLDKHQRSHLGKKPCPLPHTPRRCLPVHCSPAQLGMEELQPERTSSCL